MLLLIIGEVQGEQLPCYGSLDKQAGKDKVVMILSILEADKIIHNDQHEGQKMG